MLQDLAAPAPNVKWQMANVKCAANRGPHGSTLAHRPRAEPRGKPGVCATSSTLRFKLSASLNTLRAPAEGERRDQVLHYPLPPLHAGSPNRVHNPNPYRSCGREAHDSESKGHSGFAREAPRPTQRPLRNGPPYRRAAFGNQSSHFNTKTPSHQAEAEPEWVATVRAFSDRGLRRLPKSGGGDGG
jgi:hypothetical protein